MISINVTGAYMFVDYDVTGKVTHVFSNPAKTITSLTTKYIYDDRGFRLAKETYNTAGALQFTTWYIRDASGNVMSIYEQQAGQPTISLTEIPVYGSGKLGMARTKLDGSLEYIYEMTDHLGNVRATIKASDDVYLATMEDTGVADWTNPRVREMQHFKNLFETEKRDSRMNKTSPTVVANPERSAYLFWINDGLAATREDQVGPAIALQVDKGDSLSLEIWAKFEKKPNYTRNATTGMLADLLGSVFVNAAYGLETATQAKQVFSTNLSAALGGTGADPATQPYAYLNYLVFDNNYVVKDGGAWRVPATAGFDPGMETLPHQQVKFPSSIKPQQKGYIYIWVSNESENTKVWFDDLKVTHTKSRVVQASDYYAWGSTMREQRTPENETYRYGYQGEYAEKDLETGWNHFELREWDGVVGRWTAVDPKRQFFSPYVGMGNNPVNGIDPDGGAVLDDYQINSDGSVVFLRETDDMHHSFYAESGRLLFTTNIDLNYQLGLYNFENFTREQTIELQNAAWALDDALRHNDDLYNTMDRRARELGWNPAILGEARLASDRHKVAWVSDFMLETFLTRSPSNGTKRVIDGVNSSSTLYKIVTGGKNLWNDTKEFFSDAASGAKRFWDNAVFETKRNLHAIEHWHGR